MVVLRWCCGLLVVAGFGLVVDASVFGLVFGVCGWIWSVAVEFGGLMVLVW